jgi:hypothetical protein
MAFLWWNRDLRQVSEALSGINELKSVIGNELTRLGFANVRVNEWEVAGGKNGVWISIPHSQIADRRYWEMVIGAGDGAGTQQVVNEVVGALRALRFL